MYDSMQHYKIIEILKKCDMEWRSFENEAPNTVKICRVTQGCVLSPLLFNLYSVNIFLEALADLLGL